MIWDDVEDTEAVPHEDIEAPDISQTQDNRYDGIDKMAITDQRNQAGLKVVFYFFSLFISRNQTLYIHIVIEPTFLWYIFFS